jgi:hypothetical protein
VSTPIPFTELYKRLFELAEAFAAARDRLVESVVHKELKQCVNCRRLMVPRREWHALDVEMRKFLQVFLIGQGTADRCTTCSTYTYRERGRQVPGQGHKGPLTDHELQMLRRQVGLSK